MAVPYNHREVEKNGRLSGMTKKHSRLPTISPSPNITHW